MQVNPVRADSAVEMLLSASRVMVGVAARSLPEAADVTLHQFRALALLDTRDEFNVNTLAQVLDVRPSTVTRLCDRLVRKGLVERHHGVTDRREVAIRVSPAGSALVADVMARRRAAMAAIVAGMPTTGRRDLASGLASFIRASGEEPDRLWHLA
ncbi:MAG: MarR family winged helix-turn-helix transcriptional regulator [Acidimicrobiales bacterium]